MNCKLEYKGKIFNNENQLKLELAREKLINLFPEKRVLIEELIEELKSDVPSDDYLLKALTATNKADELIKKYGNIYNVIDNKTNDDVKKFWEDFSFGDEVFENEVFNIINTIDTKPVKDINIEKLLKNIYPFLLAKEFHVKRSVEEVSFRNEINDPCILTKTLIAEEGLKGKFRKGYKWEVVKDLKGFPSHKHGGVDLRIDEDGVKILKDGGIIKAEYGLILPFIENQEPDSPQQIDTKNDFQQLDNKVDNLESDTGDDEIKPIRWKRVKGKKYYPSKYKYPEKPNIPTFTSDEIMNIFRLRLAVARNLKNDKMIYQIENNERPFGMLEDKLFFGTQDLFIITPGKWKVIRDEKEKYYALFRDSNAGQIFYDRVYDDEINLEDYDKKTIDKISYYYINGALMPQIYLDKKINKYKLSWYLGNTSNLNDIKRDREVQFVRDWFNNPATKQRFLNMGGTEKEWENLIKTINKNLDTLKIKEPIDIPRKYIDIVGEAFYDPIKHIVYSHEKDKYYVHEITHAIHIAKNKTVENYINTIVNIYKKSSGDSFIDSYIFSPEEIYSRIMDIRDMLKIKPNQQIKSEKELKMLINKNPKVKEEPLIHLMEPTGLFMLLNFLALNNNEKDFENMS